MKVHYGFENLPKIVKPVVTTGSFDGVHIGHKVIIDRINKLAKDIGGESVLITFHPHPRRVLYPQSEGRDLFLINSQQEKINLFSKTGLDHLIIVEFTIEFSKITSIDFIRKILVGKIGASIVVVGFNHHFGHNREGDYEYLYELGKHYGFSVEEIPQQELEHETVSSTRIRKALQDGNIQRANAYLDHQYIIISIPEISSRFQAETDMLFYKVPVEEDNKLVPPDGIYAISLTVSSESFRGMAVILNNAEQTAKDSRKIELLIHLFDQKTLNEKSKATIYFHKLMALIPTGIDHKILAKLLKEEKSGIEELIY